MAVELLRESIKGQLKTIFRAGLCGSQHFLPVSISTKIREVYCNISFKIKINIEFLFSGQDVGLKSCGCHAYPWTKNNQDIFSLVIIISSNHFKDLRWHGINMHQRDTAHVMLDICTKTFTENWDSKAPSVGTLLTYLQTMA